MRERAFYDYTIYENGEIVNKHGHVMKQRVRKQKGQGARSEIKLTVKGVDDAHIYTNNDRGFR